MPGYTHGGALPPRPPTPEEIAAAEKKKVSAEKRNADRLAEIALQGTKRSLKAPIQQPKQAQPRPAAPPVQKAPAAPAKPTAAAPAPAKAPAPAPKPAAPPPPQPAQMNDLPKDEGEEEVFTDEEKSILGEEEGGVLDQDSEV